MQKVHFIAIGNAAMCNLAIANSKKNNFQITGSDLDIEEPMLTLLKSSGLQPDKPGWFPERIHKGLSAVICGPEVKDDNAELLRARELGLNVYSIPEYLFLQTRSKTRIVVAGSAGRIITTAMIVFVLKSLRIDADYAISKTVKGVNGLVKLSYESRIAVLEGDERATSIIDKRPQFHLYKPHIAVITGAQWSKDNDSQSKSAYIQHFKKFADLMEVQGRLICFEDDENMNLIMSNLRRDIVAFSYNTPAYEQIDGENYLITKKGRVLLQVDGVQNMQNIEAARLACRQIGVTDDQFFSVIGNFEGVD